MRGVLRGALVVAALLVVARARAEEPPVEKPAESVAPAATVAPAPTPAAAPAVREVGSPPPPSETGTGFSYGSYGRIGLGGDLRGHSGFATNVVSHGSRLEAPPYVELDLYYGGQALGGRWRVVVAPAFGGDLFHYNGSFASRFALRNGYIETDGIGVRGLRFWAGSRMYRGDDIYLFDYWPLDNLNTVGGGVGLRAGGNDFALHAGMNRLDDALQYQALSQPPRGLGPAISAVTVDRPRTVATAKYTRYLLSGQAGAKLVLYGEFHYLPDAVAQLRDQERTQALPSDYGMVAGAQVGGWLRPYTFANLFFRHARGLGVYGDLSLPTSTDQSRRSWPASESVFGLSLNYESEHLGVMVGSFLRRFNDPSSVAVPLSVRSYVEGAIALRPQLYLQKWLHLAAEVSFQGRSYDGFDPYLDRRLAAKVTRISVLPVISVTGTGTYARPAIYAVYTVSLLNQDARDALFDAADVRYGTSGTVHYLGVGAEWWFQSSYR